MTYEQRARIVESVRAGRTWAEAAGAAGVKAEALLQYVFDVRQGKQADPTGFVKALEEAGRHATEQAINITRRG